MCEWLLIAFNSTHAFDTPLRLSLSPRLGSIHVTVIIASGAKCC